MRLRFRLRFPTCLALIVCCLAIVACTGGGGGSGRLNVPNCTGPTKFCLTSCNLGCSVAGTCAVSEIAQNQPIMLQFSEPVDPKSVSAATISIKTASGESPAGSFFVDGPEIRFQPQVRFVGGVTTFGFRASESYILSLPANSATGQTLRSESGDPLSRTVSCTLAVTQGLVDLDGQRPVASLKVPTNRVGAPKNSPIVVSFSELIDIAPFQGNSTLTSPITYQVRKIRLDAADNPILDANGTPICDPTFEPILINGVPFATVDPATLQTDVILRPPVGLPRSVCVEIFVTDEVRDISGKPAVPVKFLFFTEFGDPEPGVITENFNDSRKLDRSISAGDWSGGIGRPGRLGGFGLLGSFDHRTGIELAPDVFLFNTDNQSFPGTHTVLGEPVIVTDGVFEFTDFTVPEGITTLFRGVRPAIIRVRGRAAILGTLSVDGATGERGYDGLSFRNPPVTGPWQPNPGESRRPGGAGGGFGGRGGRSCEGAGADPSMSGAAGEDLMAPASSGYAGQTGNTGGGGGSIWPLDGLNTSIRFHLGFISTMAAGGGGGGGYRSAATDGVVVQLFGGPADAGPNSPGGRAVPFIPPPPGISTLDHFLVGGAGAGGGGSQPLNRLPGEINAGQMWNGGAAGGGGGGALALRIGNSLTVEPNGAITARGGGGNLYDNDRGTGPPSPGGGGSGGAVIIQGAGTIRQRGLLSVTGGAGSVLRHAVLAGGINETHGGDGGYGFVRMESAGPIDGDTLGNVEGPPSIGSENFGPLMDSDTRVGFGSLFYAAEGFLPPRYLHYRLTALLGNRRVVFSDDPANFNPADRFGQPVRILFQTARLNAQNEPQGDPGRWRDYVNGNGGRQSINLDGGNGVRFMILFDRAIDPNAAVEKLEIFFES